MPYLESNIDALLRVKYRCLTKKVAKMSVEMFKDTTIGLHPKRYIELFYKRLDNVKLNIFDRSKMFKTQLETE